MATPREVKHSDLRWLKSLAYLVYKVGYDAQAVTVATKDYERSGCLTIVEKRKDWVARHSVPYELVEGREMRRILELLGKEHMDVVLRETSLVH